MRTITSCADHHEVVSLTNNRYCFTRGMVPNQAIKDGFVSVEEIPDEKGKTRKVFANTDLVMLVQGLDRTGNWCKNILFVREDKHYDSDLEFAGDCSFPDLEKIAKILEGDSTEIRYQAINGFSGALVYQNNEIAIPNPKSKGQITGWIITKKKFSELVNPDFVAINAEAIAKNALNQVSIAEARAAKALAAVENARNAAITAIKTEATSKRAAAEAAKKAAEKATTEAAEAKAAAETTKKVAADKKAAAAEANKKAEDAEKTAAEAEAKINTAA
jgi:hypothetical protein